MWTVGAALECGECDKYLLPICPNIIWTTSEVEVTDWEKISPLLESHPIVIDSSQDPSDVSQ
jgi:hypothetical protein